MDCPDPTEANRKYAVWKWDSETRGYNQTSKWHLLPEGVYFETRMPPYLQNASYAIGEGSAIRGDYVLADEANDFEEMRPGDELPHKIRYLKFSPSGRASVPNGEKRNLILVMRPGEPTGDNIEIETDMRNWVQFSIDTLTGRTRVYRP